jgi:type VI secretion system protein ImpK
MARSVSSLRPRLRETAGKAALDGLSAATTRELQGLSDAVRPLLVTTSQIQQLKRERRPPPELAYKLIRELIGQVNRQLEALGLSPEAQNDVRYALVAFVDEAMQLDPGPLKEFWQAHLLQLELFGETRAGEGFFERLQSLRNDGNVPVLFVYYLCLLFGFHGVYGRQGELERENLMVSIQQALGSVLKQRKELRLSPHGARPNEPEVDRERNRLLQWLSITAFVVAAFWYVGLVFAVDADRCAPVPWR